jgi:hypothetical protein
MEGRRDGERREVGVVVILHCGEMVIHGADVQVHAFFTLDSGALTMGKEPQVPV